MERSCGLLTCRKEPVPLKSVSVTLSINDFVAGVSATLNYENEEKVPLEAFFVFSMDEDSAVYSLEALVDGKTIVAELQEKMKAHSSYEYALSQGQKAYLLEANNYSRDVFSCNVGNLQPGAKVALTLKYVQELNLEEDGAQRHMFPAILNPRYQLSDRSGDSCLDMKTPIGPLEDLPYTLSLVATISSQHSIERVQSNCSLNPVEYLGQDKTSAQVSLAEGHKFDRDVELLIYYGEVHSPSVPVEMGMPEMNWMGAPSAMVGFYPDISEVEISSSCGKFVFLMDRSGSMNSPMSNQARSQLQIDAAKETLTLLMKSLPLGCYFNIYGFGSSYESFFPTSVQYTQKTMEELFVFTDGEVNDTFTLISEVKLNSNYCRCFSFGIEEGASTSLIKGIAQESWGYPEFIPGKDRMQTKALRSLKSALQSAVEGICLSWDLPAGLSANRHAPEQTVIFRGQKLIIYSQLTCKFPLLLFPLLCQAEASGKVCLKYTLQGKSFEEEMRFSLQPKANPSFTIHRLAAKSLIQNKDLGSHQTSESDKEDVLKVSILSGVLSSFTAFVAINKELNQPVQGPLAQRNISMSTLFSSLCPSQRKRVNCMPTQVSLGEMEKTFSSTNATDMKNYHKATGESVVQLISLQKANGSWDLDENLPKVLDTNLGDIQAANPAKHEHAVVWATVLAVLCLHASSRDVKCEWELLEKKAVAWLHDHAGSPISILVKAANTFLKLCVNPAVLDF
ncbi:LOW QUALITY PROTEIN: von Willebrand factor A domain-containing protein 5A-like [Nannospalax galili]|nr:LOW QUALITY PROTEIN: von Willebrand factor A domain-containing protein 5A-like [Nannospalax galili]